MKILLVDDHTLFRSALTKLLAGFEEVEAVYEASDGSEGVSAACRINPDLIVMDLRMPRCSGIAAIREIKRRLPQSRVLVLTVSERDDDLVQALRAGAAGYLLKNATPDEFRRAILALSSGEGFVVPSIAARVLRELSSDEDPHRPLLTPKERDILRVLARGASNADIARSLCISRHTVKGYLSRLMEKLGLENRVQLAVYAVNSGVASEPGAVPEPDR